MTAVPTVPAPATEPVPEVRASTGATRLRQRRRARRSRLAWLIGAGLAALALALRLVSMTSANDVFIDELLYAGFAAQAADGVVPNEGGHPFLLHPPMSLLLDAAAINLFGLGGTPVDLVLELRWVNAVLGALTVALVFALVRTVVNLPAAMAAAAIVTFDPFVLRNNGRVMIETPAVTFLLAGWLVLLTTAKSRSRRVVLTGELGAGLLLGLALVTKDMTVIPGAGALLVAVVWKRTLRPWTAVRVALASFVPYLAYLSLLGGAGLLPLWLADKSAGLQRMLGLRQDTGFNSVEVSLVDRLIDEIPRFGTSYVLLGLALIAGPVAAFSAVPAQRVTGIVATCSALMGAYALVGGAAEEQFGYYVIVLAVPALAVAGQLLVRRLRVPRRAAEAVVDAFVVLTVVLGISSRLAVDDGFARLETWLETELPRGADVAVTGDTGEYAFPDYDVSSSLAALEANENDYAITAHAPLAQGYGYASPELLRWLEDNARPVFEFDGPTNDGVVVWRIDRAALEDDVADGVRIPPAETATP